MTDLVPDVDKSCPIDGGPAVTTMAPFDFLAVTAVVTDPPTRDTDPGADTMADETAEMGKRKVLSFSKRYIVHNAGRFHRFQS